MDGPLNKKTEAGAGPRYTFIATSKDFQKVLQRLKSSSRIAIDIEADSLYHYYEKVCLIQISSDSDTYILDPLEVAGIESLAPMGP